MLELREDKHAITKREKCKINVERERKREREKERDTE